MISVFFEFLTRGLIWIIKCIFDMILFYLRLLFKILRLLLAILPATAIVYSCFFFILTVEIIAGENVFSSLIPIQIDSTAVKDVIVNTLRDYLSILSQYSGTLMYFILFLILLILAVPLFLTFVSIGTFVYVGKLFIIPVLIDVLLYFIRCFFTGKTPFDIITSRYRVLFPEAGRRLNKKSYDRWLRRHHDEFENDTYGKVHKKTPLEGFYEEDVDDEDSYEEEYDDDYDDSEDNEALYYRKRHPFYEEDYYPEDYDDEEDYEYDYDEIYEDRIEDRHHEKSHHHDTHSKASGAPSGFNFFAGCTTLESATKKYRSLVKLYHPDNLDGDTTALQEINAQYNEIKRRLS